MKQLEIKNLSFEYSRRDHAINDLSLSVDKGEWISIIGHNGSGKSTLSKLINGLLMANSGEIYIDGELLTPDSVSKLRKKIGIVFQNPDNQFVGVTVKHDIAFGLENLQIPRSDMLSLIDRFSTRVEMKEFLEKEPHNLSGGQKQRVAIAGILAMNCDIMIFDEATSMLDPKGVNDITNLLIELHEEYHKTMITITHDLDLASLSDRVVVMKQGKIVLDGRPEEVFTHVDELIAADLDIPFNLKLYNAVKNDPQLSVNEGLVKSLWQLNLKK